MLATVVAAVADGTALVVAQLTLLFDLALLGDGEGSAAIILTFAVVRAVASSAAARREQSDSTSIITRTTTLLFIVGWRELNFSADSVRIGETANGRQVPRVDMAPQLGTVAKDLLHDNAVAELGEQAVDTLDSGVGERRRPRTS